MESGSGCRTSRLAIAALRPLWLALGLLAACHPDVAGRCSQNTDCRTGARCDQTNHICVKDATVCSPACGSGQVCQSGACQPIQPTVTLKVDASALLSPSKSGVVVHVESDPALVLGQLKVEASTLAGALVASGSNSTAAVGDQTVQLGFAGPVQTTGNLVATLAYTDPANAAQSIRSLTVPVQLDSIAPVVQVAVQAASDSVGGWFPRTSANVTVLATLTDAGSGPDTCTLTIDAGSCPSGQTCVFPGALQGSVTQGVGTYKFSVPRTLQAAGAESRLGFSVKGVDKAGNQASAVSALPIDDKAPSLGSFTAVTAGVTGEDGHAWYPAGAQGKDVEVAFSAADSGSGLSVPDLVLTLVAADLDAGQSPTVQGFLPTPADGTIHFRIPTGRTSNREGRLHFSVAIKDKLGHATSLPVSDTLSILVDDVPPQVIPATPDYLRTSPSWDSVCGQADLGGTAGGFHCGRGTKTAPDRALRDDVVPAGFTVIDCGSGVAAALPRFTVESAGQPSAPADATAGTPTAGSCANGSANALHAYSFNVDLAAAAPLLSPPDADGSALVFLSQTALDRVGRQGTSPAPPTSATGSVRLTRVRWQAELTGNAAGAPALVFTGPVATPQATPRTLAVPLAPASAVAAVPHAVELLDATGKLLTPVTLKDTARGAAVYDAPAGDVVAADGSTLWLAGQQYACNLASCSKVWLTQLGASAPASAACTPEITGVQGALAVKLGGSTGSDVAVTAVTDKQVADQAATWASSGGGALACAEKDHYTSGIPILSTQAFSGVSLASDSAFLASAKGFVSVPVNGGGGFGTPELQFTDSSIAALPAAPALLGGGAHPVPLFAAWDAASGPTVHKLRKALYLAHGTAPCTGAADCWVPAGTPWADLDAVLSHTPVHDGAQVFGVDDNGTLLGADLGSGAGTGQVHAVDLDGATAKTQPVSPPVLLASTGARASVLVQSNGWVRLAAAAGGDAGALNLVLVNGSGGKRPPPPVIDGRGSGGVAYVVDGGCTAAQPAPACGPAWVWAVQLDSPPLAASATAWPRPARDSCNSRHLEAACP